MKNMLVVLAMFCGAVAFGGTWHVVPGGEGDGTSWTSGASLDSILPNVADGDVVLLRQGVHSVSTAVTLTDMKLVLRGGYAVGDADDAPSGDKYSTIISADAALDNVWVSFDPETKAKTVVLEDGEPMKVIKDGALNLPPDYTAKYQVYYPAEVGEGGAITDPVGLVGAFITFAGSASCDISNVTFSGFGDTTTTADGDILAWPPTKFVGNGASTVRQVAFIGNAAKGTLVGCTGNNTANQPCGDFTDVEVRFCRLNEGSAIRFNNWTQPPSFTNCVFESLYGENALRTDPLALNLGGRPPTVNIDTCTFTRLVHIAGEKWSNRDDHYILNGAPNACAVAMSLGSANPSTLQSVTITSCWIDNTRATTLLGFGNFVNIHDLHFRDNYVKAWCTRALRCSIGGLVTFSGTPIFDRCTFVSNRLEVVTAPPTVGALPTEVYAAPIVNHGCNTLFGDCVFADNSVDISGVETETKKLARAVMMTVAVANGGVAVDMVKCTCTGDTPGDDIVLTRTLDYNSVSQTLRMGLYDSIFWSEAHDYPYAGATMDVTEALPDCLTFQRSVVKNAGQIPGAVNFIDCTSADPMLKYDPATGLPRPTVAVEGVKGHPLSWNLTVKNAAGAYVFRHGCDMGTTNMFILTVLNPANKTLTSPLISRRSSGGNYAINDANVTARADILGAERTPDNAVAGAVEATFPEGRILTASASPVGSGYVTIGSQYADEGGFGAITAVSVDPLFSFQKWVDENGETVSTSETFTFTGAGDYNKVTAVFGAPQTTWTFRVDPEKGTFADGSTEIVLTLSPGDDAPGFPEVRTASAWHQTGWDKAMPAQVGSAALEFSPTFIPYTKVVYFDSNATGANCGTNWADAFTDLSVAIGAAGGVNSYVGEVRVRQGRHLIPFNKYPAFKNVRLIGGWTGNGEERSSDRHLTVFTGDIKDDDIFVDQHGNTVGKVYENGKFIEFRPPTEEEGYWELANYAEDSAQCLTPDNTVACTNALIECCSFYGFYGPQHKFIQSGKYINLTITNCDVMAIHQVYAGNPANISMGAAGRILDCGFYGMTGAYLLLQADDNSKVFEVRNCKFLYSTRNVASGRSVTVFNLQGGSLQAEDIEVGHFLFGNYLEEGTGNSNSSPAILLNGNYYQHATSPTWIKRAYVHDIRAPKNDKPVQFVAMDYCDSAAVLEDCVFENIEYGEEYSSTKTYKNTDTILFSSVKNVTNCVFRNFHYTYTGDPATVCAVLLSVRDAIAGTTFENCRIDTTMNSYSYLLMQRGNGYLTIGDGNSFTDCSVTNTGTRTADNYGVAGLIGGRATNMNSQPIKRIGQTLVRNCSVCAPNMRDAFLIDDVGRKDDAVVDGLTVVNSTVEGGTINAGVIRTYGGVWRNVTVAECAVIPSEGATAVGTVWRINNPLDIGWSTFHGNDAPYGFFAQFNGKIQLNLTSSVVTSPFEGWSAFGVSREQDLPASVLFANSYVSGVDSESPCCHGDSANVFTVEPLMTGVVRNRRQRRYGVYHAPQSPYAHDAELSGVYSDEAPVDAAGVARPPEGQILIGAMQTTYAAPGLMILVK